MTIIKSKVVSRALFFCFFHLSPFTLYLIPYLCPSPTTPKRRNAKEPMDFWPGKRQNKEEKSSPGEEEKKDTN